MPVHVLPSFLRLEDGTFLNTLYIVKMKFSDDAVVLTLSTPDASGNREITLRDPERIEKLRKSFVFNPTKEEQT